jgi:hypothetical protein
MLVEFGKKVFAFPQHFMYQRYTNAPAIGAILAMDFEGDPLAGLAV